MSPMPRKRKSLKAFAERIMARQTAEFGLLLVGQWVGNHNSPMGPLRRWVSARGSVKTSDDQSVIQLF